MAVVSLFKLMHICTSKIQFPSLKKNFFFVHAYYFLSREIQYKALHIQTYTLYHLCIQKVRLVTKF